MPREKTVAAAKRGASPAAGGELTEEVRYVLEQLPGAEFRRKFNGVSFFTGAKVFAFLIRDGVVVKLPEERVKALAQVREARPLVMGKRVMREWVVVALPRGLRGEVDLLREAMGFVAAGGRGGKAGA